MRRKCSFKKTALNQWKCSQCGHVFQKDSPKPPFRMCGPYTPPEPRTSDDVAFILGTLCPGCSHYHADQICHCGNCSKGVPIARLIEFGHCPAYRW